jgi:integrase
MAEVLDRRLLLHRVDLSHFERGVGRQPGLAGEPVVQTADYPVRERKKPGGKVGLAPMTMKNYLIALKAALGWAVEQKLLSAVPAFPEVKVPKKKPQPVPQEHFDKLLAAAPDDRWKAYLLCGWWGGLRLSEARHLRWSRSDEFPWVDLGRRVARRGRRTIRRRSPPVRRPCSPPAAALRSRGGRG